MKRIAYLFLLMFTIGCGSSSELKGTRINVVFRDSLTVPHEYHLLYVRDSELVVAPGFYDGPGVPMTIPNSKIKHVVHAGHGKDLGAFLGGIIGGTVVIGTIIYIGVRNGGDSQSGEGIAIAGAFLGTPAIILGAIIGSALASDEDEYNLEKPHDRYMLGGYAVYPDTEPPELQKIK